MARQKEFEREEVLEKALEVFWCKGYNATSFQTLTEGMCINRQSIYDTYGDKHALFIEALKHYYKKNSECLAAHFSQPKPVKVLFMSFFENTIINTTCRQKDKGCFLQNVTLEMVPEDPEVQDIVNQNLQNLAQTFEATIRRGIQSGEIITSQSPETLSMYLVNTAQGLITLGKTITETSKLRSVAEVAINALG